MFGSFPFLQIVLEQSGNRQKVIVCAFLYFMGLYLRLLHHRIKIGRVVYNLIN